jgi:hypothetical protein
MGKENGVKTEKALSEANEVAGYMADTNSARKCSSHHCNHSAVASEDGGKKWYVYKSLGRMQSSAGTVFDLNP